MLSLNKWEEFHLCFKNASHQQGLSLTLRLTLGNLFFKLNCLVQHKYKGRCLVIPQLDIACFVHTMGGLPFSAQKQRRSGLGRGSGWGRGGKGNFSWDINNHYFLLHCLSLTPDPLSMRDFHKLTGWCSSLPQHCTIYGKEAHILL